MKQPEIKQRIEQNMAAANLEIADIRVQPDPLSGWRIAVVA